MPPHYRGGAELRALRTARELRARGHDVMAIAVEDIHSGPTRGLAWEDDALDGVPVRRLRFRLEDTPDPFRYEYDNAWIGDHLRDWFAAWKPDLFHLFSGYLLTGSALRAAQAQDVATVVSLTDYWFLCRRINLLRSNGELSTLPIDPARCARCFAEERRRYRIPGRVAPQLMDAWWRGQSGEVERFAQRRDFLLDTLNRVERMISPSRFLRDVHVEAGVAAERILCLRQGSAYSDHDPRRAQKPPSSALRLGYIGQIAPHKGVHVLLEALQKVGDSDVRLTIHGDATQFPEYADRIQRMVRSDNRCELRGPFAADQLTSILREIDVLVVPSLWYENSPNVILEAYGHGTPVVVSDLGGMAEMVEDGRSGLCFPMGDAGALAAVVERLVHEYALRETLREGAMAWQMPSLTEEMDALERVYHEVVDGAGAGLNAPAATLVTQAALR